MIFFIISHISEEKNGKEFENLEKWKIKFGTLDIKC